MSIDLSRFSQGIPSQAYLWVATLVFAASNSVTRKVTDIGAQHLVSGRNPISLCNVLFVGNLCAFFVLWFVFRKELTPAHLRQLSRSDWLSLLAIAILSGALAPALIFTALGNTNVTNVVLIGRIEPPLTLALSVLLLRERANLWTVLGAILAFVGVAAAAFVGSSGQSSGGLRLGLGELQTTAGAVVLAIATTISKARLARISLGIFTVFRTIVGAIIFFVTAIYLYGAEHFIDVFAPVLWGWMLAYGALIVVAGQLCWFAGLKKATAAEVSIVSSFTPVAAILMGFLILGEVPTVAQYVGGSIILAGVVLSLVDNLRQPTSPPRGIALAQKMEADIGFKGV